jgi:hypothetical protein
MRTLMAVGILAAASFLTAPRAEAATWCYEGEHGYTCGFISLQQCLDTVWGNAPGTCLFEPLGFTQEIVRTRQPRRPAAAPAPREN